MFKLLLDAGGDVSVQDQYGISPLMCAAEHGREVMAKLILKSCKHNSKLQSTLVQQQTNMLATALHFACQNKHPNVRDALIQAGADPEAKDYAGRTPMHLEERRPTG